MNFKDLDLFIKAAKEIFIEIGFQDLIVEECTTKDQKYDLIANIGITGEISGFLLIRSDIKSSMKFINKMLTNMGMEAEESDFGQFHKEAFGEILNQISGRSAMLLEYEGINCNITPPGIIRGSNIAMGTYAAAEIINKTIKGSFGSFNLFVGVKE